jgi:hypothetical protein
VSAPGPSADSIVVHLDMIKVTVDTWIVEGFMPAHQVAWNATARPRLRSLTHARESLNVPTFAVHPCGGAIDPLTRELIAVGVAISPSAPTASRCAWPR